jgi:hypothetical protein
MKLLDQLGELARRALVKIRDGNARGQNGVVRMLRGEGSGRLRGESALISNDEVTERWIVRARVSMNYIKETEKDPKKTYSSNSEVVTPG